MSTDRDIARWRSLIDRLLHDEDTRSRFLRGGPSAIGASEEEARALAAVDGEQLESTARKIVGDLVTRRHRGSLGLLETYRDTLAGWQARHPGEDVRASLLVPFVASRHYAEYRELSSSRGPGRCVEEAFYRFLVERDVGDPRVRRREYLEALFRALAVQPRPAFSVPDEVVRLPGDGYRYVDEEELDAPRLYAVVGTRVLMGAITPLLARVLAHDGIAPSLAGEEWDACVRKLRAMGLLSS